MVDDNHLGSKKLTVLFRKEGSEETHFVKNRVAQTLLWLVYTQEKGVTAAEVQGWAVRLAAYVFRLRKHYGLDIVTIREPHDGGSHARYVLRVKVEILEIIPETERG